MGTTTEKPTIKPGTDEWYFQALNGMKRVRFNRQDAISFFTYVIVNYPGAQLNAEIEKDKVVFTRIN
jgi:hypothetical protein